MNLPPFFFFFFRAGAALDDEAAASSSLRRFAPSSACCVRNLAALSAFRFQALIPRFDGSFGLAGGDLGRMLFGLPPSSCCLYFQPKCELALRLATPSLACGLPRGSYLLRECHNLFPHGILFLINQIIGRSFCDLLQQRAVRVLWLRFAWVFLCKLLSKVNFEIFCPNYFTF